MPYFTESEEKEPSEEFIAYRFKTQWCPVGGPHDWENCVYAHTYRDWRRVPNLGYASHPCQRWSSSVSTGSAELQYWQRCPNGIGCPLAHGAKEQLYHPQFYKMSPCSDVNCKRGPLCAFTHGEEDARQLPLEISAPQGLRKQILGAEDILTFHQQTWCKPPVYHALEEVPRLAASPGGKSRKDRGHHSLSSPTKQPARPRRKMEQSPSMRDMAQMDMSFSPYYWTMPGDHMQAFQSQPAYGMVADSPQSYGSMQYWGGPLSPCFFSPQLSPSSPNGVESHFFLPVLSPTASELPDYSSRMKTQGWRTPSSFASSPPSIAPTVVSTPRTTGEACESTSASTDSADADMKLVIVSMHKAKN